MKTNEIIRMLRENLEPKVNQTQMGKIFNMSQKKMSRIETGETEPDLDTLKAICRYFNLSADYILGLVAEPRKLYRDK